ncbi:hypothetical protein [Dokdonella koreensis]|uniref:DUF883 domain-containing protein n=1 Tax=Dokdonella koreensis DS-123 TaxID=1300342 RepID=A0A160DXM6_9GAMM|nr:hypothetical protein [Dokdonella koreensis]ANB19061.1 Hypothetical protein I596_3069 [Dokdonella koreensis DS-123]
MASIRDVKQGASKAADDLAGAAENAGSTLKEGLKETADELHRLGDRLRANGSHLEDELRDAGRRFGEGARKFGDTAAEQIRAHPLAAFGIAFAAGMIVTRWLRR